MAEQIANRVGETTTTTGTGTLSLAGAKTGYQGFVAGVGSGNICRFLITDGTDWEISIGLLTDAAPDTLTRVTVESSSNAGAKVVWGAGSKDVYNVHTAASVLRLIFTNTTFYLGTGGNDSTGKGTAAAPWLTIQHALDYLADYWWDTTNVTITITCADGTYTPQAAITPSHPCAKDDALIIKGTNTHAKNITSVQSFSGSAGAWAIIVNLESVADIAVNDYVIISAGANGTKPTFINGCHKVTNVDSGNTRITFTSTHQHATAPSGAVTATVKVIKCMMSFTNGTHGISITDGSVSPRFEDMVFIGDGSTAGTNGVNLDKGSTIVLGDQSNYGMGFVNWKNMGIAALYNCTIIAKKTALSGILEDGILAEYGSVADVSYGIISGCTDMGARAVYAAELTIDNGVITGCGDDHINAKYVCIVSANNLVSTGCGDVAYKAQNSTFIEATGGTVSDNGTDYSPALNTEGNVLSYIKG